MTFLYNILFLSAALHSHLPASVVPSPHFATAQSPASVQNEPTGLDIVEGNDEIFDSSSESEDCDIFSKFVCPSLQKWSGRTGLSTTRLPLHI